MSSHKMLVIGLDGATFDLIDPLIAEGKLPTLARIAKSGGRAHLRSTIPHHSGPAWTSFATGMEPGNHGVYSFFQRDYESYTYPPVNSRSIRGETLWQLLGRLDKTVGVMNVPGTFPPSPVKGFMITGMLSPGLDRAFYPPELREQVLQQSPDYSVEAIPLLDRSEYLEKVYGSIEARKKTALYLLDEFSSDLFVIVFTELDRLQHFFWADMDAQHPAHSPATLPERSQAIEKAYVILDQAVQSLIEAAGPDTNVLIMSDHGFEGIYKIFYVNRWLAERGYLKLKERDTGTAIQRVKDILQRVGLWRLARQAGEFVLGSNQFSSKNLSYTVDIDWERTQAAFGPNLGININLKGRECKGVVSPGPEYEEICTRIRRELEDYTDPETHEPVVERVLRREEVYAGDAVHLAPDLRLTMARSSQYRGGRYAYSPKVCAPQTLAYPDKVQGNHAEYGIFLAQGPDIKAGVRVSEARIIDVAPTILYAMGSLIPDAMDGRPLVEIFGRDIVRARSEKEDRAENVTSTALDQAFTTEAEEEQILERLRGLGYLD